MNLGVVLDTVADMFGPRVGFGPRDGGASYDRLRALPRRRRRAVRLRAARAVLRGAGRARAAGVAVRRGLVRAPVRADQLPAAGGGATAADRAARRRARRRSAAI